MPGFLVKNLSLAHNNSKAGSQAMIQPRHGSAVSTQPAPDEKVSGPGEFRWERLVRRGRLHLRYVLSQGSLIRREYRVGEVDGTQMGPKAFPVHI